MSIFKRIYQRAKRNPRQLVLPEGEDERIIETAYRATNEKIARIVLLGDENTIIKKAKKLRISLKKIDIIDPRKDEKRDEYIDAYWQLRKHKGLSQEQAKELLLNNFVYYAAMMVRLGVCDGFIAGACHTTSNVARAAFHCIKRDERIATASGSFLVEVKDKKFGKDGLFLFADCAIVPTPSVKQLANIAQASADLWIKVTGYKARVGMLSFSSKGSSQAEEIQRVKEATSLIKTERPDLLVDGEVQVDSAIVPHVAKIKVPLSPLKGRANILIFPNLDSGNIAYKLMQRLAHARVVGPLIQGLSKPCSDLSRGCEVQEIVDVIAVTSVRAQ